MAEGLKKRLLPAAMMSAAVALSALAACSLFVDTSGLESGAPSTQDSGTPTGSDGAVTDGPGVVSEGGSSGGGGNVDGQVVDGNPTSNSPCVTPQGTAVHLFCDDFDNGGGTEVQSRWEFFSDQAGPMSLTTTQSISAPRSLMNTTTQGDGLRKSFLGKSFPFKVGSTMTIAFDVRVDKTSAGSWDEMNPFEIELKPTGDGLTIRSLWLGIHSDSSFFQYFAVPTDAGANDDRRSNFNFPLNVWHHVVTTLQKGSASMNVDGTSHDLTFPDRSFDSIILYVGNPYANDVHSDWTIYIDNVVVDN